MVDHDVTGSRCRSVFASLLSRRKRDRRHLSVRPRPPSIDSATLFAMELTTTLTTQNNSTVPPRSTLDSYGRNSGRGFDTQSPNGVRGVPGQIKAGFRLLDH